MPVTCKKCLCEYDELIKIDMGMKLRLQETSNEAHSLSEVCNNCFDLLKEEVNQGAKLMAEQNQQEQNKQMLWKNRVGFVKEARERMGVKSFSEAAVLYEKYLRALEIVHGIPAGQLDPLIFNAPGKSSEITILCTVYWDLFKVYDSSPKYLDRQKMVGTKLLSIVPFSSVQSDLLKKAERYVREAKEPANAREFLGKLREATGASGCFIATAAFGSYDQVEVVILREFRDEILEQSTIGRNLIRFYYATSPRIAGLISKSEMARSLTRSLIQPIAMLLANKFNLNKPPRV